jgi:glucose-6-phosphate 1-dehydrogenase
MALMEKPRRWGAEELRGAKRAALDAVRVYTPSEALKHLVAGQYIGYRQTPHVAPDSRTPTFAALRLYVDNYRWRGVPVYLRSGKAMKKRFSEVVMQFRCPDGDEFFSPVCDPARANRLTMRIQPQENIKLTFQVKEPDTLDGLILKTSELEFDYNHEFGHTALPEAYERLILDVIHGDPTLFTRSDVIDRAWEIMDPIIAATEKPGWQSLEYPIGSWGPPEADVLVQTEQDRWQNPTDL